MSNFKLIAIPGSKEIGEQFPDSIQICDSANGKWQCNILSTEEIVFNSEVDHRVMDVQYYCKLASMFHTLFNNIKTG